MLIKVLIFMGNFIKNNMNISILDVFIFLEERTLTVQVMLIILVLESLLITPSMECQLQIKKLALKLNFLVY